MDPALAAMLGFGSSMLGASGPSAVPVGFGQALGAGIGGGLNAYAMFDQMRRQQEQDDLQRLNTLMAFQRIAQQQDQDRQRQAALQRFAATRSPEQQALLAAAPDQALAAMVKQELGGPPGAQSPLGRMRADLASGLITQQDFANATARREAAQGPMTPIGRLRADLAAGRINQADFDAAMAQNAPRGPAEQTTALMRNARYLARVRNIPEAEALQIVMQSANARADPEEIRQRLFEKAFEQNPSDPEGAATAANKAFELLQRGPGAMAAPAPAEDPGVMAKLWNLIRQSATGSGPPPVAAAPEQAPAEPELSGPPSELSGPPASSPSSSPVPPSAAPTGEISPSAAGAASALPVSPEGKIDRNALQPGAVYTHPDGRKLRWTGTDFEVLE